MAPVVSTAMLGLATSRLLGPFLPPAPPGVRSRSAPIARFEVTDLGLGHDRSQFDAKNCAKSHLKMYMRSFHGPLDGKARSRYLTPIGVIAEIASALGGTLLSVVRSSILIVRHREETQRDAEQESMNPTSAQDSNSRSLTCCERARRRPDTIGFLSDLRAPFPIASRAGASVLLHPLRIKAARPSGQDDNRA